MKTKNDSFKESKNSSRRKFIQKASLGTGMLFASPVHLFSHSGAENVNGIKNIKTKGYAATF